ncbi:MAG: BrnA antitoxin family protein [Sumerlaeia bacterium]
MRDQAENVTSPDSPLEDRTDYARLEAMTDEQIAKAVAEDPDAAPIMSAEELMAKLNSAKARKQAVSIRLDAEVIEFFKSGGPGYQSRINAALRSVMESVKRKESQA